MDKAPWILAPPGGTAPARSLEHWQRPRWSYLWFHVVSIVMACRGGYPKKWIVDIVDMENPIQLDDLGLPPISGNPHMSFNNIPEKSNLKFGVMCKIDETWPAIEVKPAISSVAITSLFQIG